MVGHAMVVASAQADLLIVARDGDRERLGPRSLGKTIRFVVDHAACPVQLVWPGSAPDVATIPPPHHPSPVLDAVGHDLAAGLLASVAMASCRSARRSGGTLHDIVTRADHAIARQFGESRFVTALLCDLDVATGVFSWIPAGTRRRC